MATYAAVADVEELWAQEFTDAERTLVERRLAQAERTIRRRISDLDDRAAEPDYRADLIDIESDVVLRVIRNPDGYQSEQDGEYGYRFHPEAASGKLEITDEEWRTLGAGTSLGMFVFVPVFG
ncbi:Gp19/Gp15/Gp42 family protein [Mycolicibacterium obuense]|uniref:Phage protein Gp19/Gp15/Gp42 n=1 Tax=Mycolicibacterium obuense TaxID=1807 RepID=A0A0J6Y774_9MYCO|nr:Gp19/Gp15/Gp42 family protein [Mycolicibacterium obuense]KMO68896.1 Phage protein Gp19/Gp15/Gp42 [Mycolicibacterium obuense]